ncbi:hypothetical protein [Pedomonas mirosovicensis]|uniref:hypothetical protein n=1 Tax=Pedomonas mirosovicensis TaxID=2908641 RepID=UPI0021675FF1|nr:hypothetical protein [Pedomonas mirosovicensis]MCH8684776.1 hypothetical protein [Pedomonas mirosovicensis]
MSADLTNMGDAQLESFISNCDLQDWQKDELRQKGKYERSTYYANAIWAKSLSDTHFAAQEFRRSVLRNSIYLRPDVFKQIEAFANRICEVVFNYQLDWQAKSDGVYNTKEDDVIQAYREAGKDQYERLGEYLRNHYWEVKTL